MHDWKSYVRRRLPALGLSGSREAEVIEELAQHLEASYEEARNTGASEDEALASVETLFPDWSALERELRRSAREPWSAERTAPVPRGGGGWIGSLWADLRYGARTLGKSPSFTWLALLTLALGIGANAFVFSVVDGVLLRPLPYREPGRLAIIRADVEGERGIASLSAIELLDLRERSEAFEDFAGVWSSSAAITGDDSPEQIRYAWATRNLHSMMGVEPILGRHFSAEEEASNGPPVVMLSGELWDRRFGADPNVVGRTIEIDDRMRSVVGVLPPGFRLLMGADTDVASEIEAWVPQTYWINRNMRWLRILGRLRPRVTFEQAQEELDVIAADLTKEFAEYARTDLALRVVPLHGDLVRDVEPAVVALFGAVGFVLLIACVNIANLMLTKTKARGKELAVRVALGASRSRVVRQIVAESSLLALGGGLLGLFLAHMCVEAFPRFAPANLPRLDELAVDGRVTLFVVVASLLTSLVFGVLPAVQATSLNLHDTLKDGRRTSRGVRAAALRNGLVVGEIAISFVLLVGGGLMLQTILNLEREDLGFEPRKLLTMEVPFSEADYPTAESQWIFCRMLQERLESLPGVLASGGASLLPLGGGLFTSPYAYDAETERDFGALSADYRMVTPGYFETMGARLVEGRFFVPSDIASGRRTVVIDDTLARAGWPEDSPTGKRLKVDLSSGVAETHPEWMDIVGVVKHLRHERVRRDGRPQVYFPLWLQEVSRMTVVIRTSGDPDLLAGAVQTFGKELGNDRPVHTVRTMEDYVDDAMAKSRFTVRLMLVFAGTALALAAIGVYGVISFSVSQRAHELGIRVAVGARASDVVEIVLGHGAVLVLTGVGLGLGGAFALARTLDALVFGVATTDPITYAAVALLLMFVSFAACARPAWRGARVDPVTTLRQG